MPFPLLLAGVAAAVLAAQAPAPSWLKPVSRVSAEASVETPPGGAAAGRLVVVVDVRPAPGIHVYAPGNKNYIAVDLSVEAPPGVRPGKADYPPAEPFVFGELKEVVQVYAKPFRIRLPLAVDTGATRPRALAATLRYQACTDRICYPPAVLPLDVALPPSAAR